jgi:hypothetical protein
MHDPEKRINRKLNKSNDFFILSVLILDASFLIMTVSPNHLFRWIITIQEIFRIFKYLRHEISANQKSNNF